MRLFLFKLCFILSCLTSVVNGQVKDSIYIYSSTDSICLFNSSLKYSIGIFEWIEKHRSAHAPHNAREDACPERPAAKDIQYPCIAVARKNPADSGA